MAEKNIKTKNSNIVESVNNSEQLEEISSKEEEVSKDNSLQEAYDKLELQIKQQAEQIQQLLSMINSNSNQTSYNSIYGPTIKIMHLVQRDDKLKTLINLSNITIIMRDLGEERTLTLQQFEELVGKYRRWFDLGIIGVCSGYEDIAVKYGIKAIKSYPLSKDLLNKIATLDINTLENIFSKLPIAGKETVISYWKRQIINNNPNFKDIRKMEVLNRLSDGAFSQTISDLNEDSKRK